jgi:RNA polymerase sigma factor (sigma-70 family)
MNERTMDEENSWLATRRSLLTRLKDPGDQPAWQRFFDMYWRLIFSIARRSGLSEAESHDVVQETLLVVIKQMETFRYDPQRGSFKAWLHTVVRGRLSRHWRKARSEARAGISLAPLPAGADTESAEPEAPPEFETLWLAEWEENLMGVALRRVQTQVSSRQFLLFSLAVVKRVPLATIRQSYEASVAQIYLARHRVGKLVKAEVARVRAEYETGGPPMKEL